jgi:hypothetical protein
MLHDDCSDAQVGPENPCTRMVGKDEAMLILPPCGNFWSSSRPGRSGSMITVDDQDVALFRRAQYGGLLAEECLGRQH